MSQNNWVATLSLRLSVRKRPKTHLRMAYVLLSAQQTVVKTSSLLVVKRQSDVLFSSKRVFVISLFLSRYFQMLIFRSNVRWCIYCCSSHHGERKINGACGTESNIKDSSKMYLLIWSLTFRTRCSPVAVAKSPKRMAKYIKEKTLNNIFVLGKRSGKD